MRNIIWTLALSLFALSAQATTTEAVCPDFTLTGTAGEDVARLCFTAGKEVCYNAEPVGYIAVSTSERVLTYQFQTTDEYYHLVTINIAGNIVDRTVDAAAIMYGVSVGFHEGPVRDPVVFYPPQVCELRMAESTGT